MYDESFTIGCFAPTPLAYAAGNMRSAGLRSPSNKRTIWRQSRRQGLDPVWAAAQQRGVLRVATDFGYAPFTGTRRTASGEQPYGFDIDLAQAIAAKLGLRAEFVPTSLESAYEAITADHADVVISALPYAPGTGLAGNLLNLLFQCRSGANRARTLSG